MRRTVVVALTVALTGALAPSVTGPVLAAGPSAETSSGPAGVVAPRRAAEPRAVEPSGSGPASESDFNGDGYEDVAIGAPFDDVAGQADAGVVHVIYGSGTGPTSAGSQVWHQNRPDLADAAEPRDHFGRSVATGDFNADGYDDLAIGVPHEDLGGRADQGMVNILFGSPTGLVADSGQGRLTLDPEGAPLAQAGAQFGFALASLDAIARQCPGSTAGSDGVDDLAIGVPGFSGVGSVFIAFGVLLDPTVGCGGLWDPDLAGASPGARVGSTLAAGRFDSGGGNDLAIGAPRDSFDATGPRNDAGTVMIVMNGTFAFRMRQDAGFANVPENGDRLGSALATGDINGDGYDDLVAGAPYEDLEADTDAGIVHVTFSRSNGTGLDVDSFFNIHADSAGVPGARHANDRLGAALAVGQFGVEAGQDVAIGMPGAPTGSVRGGAVVVLYNDGSGLSTSQATNQRWHQDRSGVPGAPEAGDEFGATLMAANLNGDAVGRDELMVGIPREDIGTVANAGAVDMLRGSNGGLVPGFGFLQQGAGGIGEGVQAGDRFGFALPGSSALPAGSTPSMGFTQNIHEAANDNTQSTNCWCVVASAKTMIKYLVPSFNVTQKRLHAYMSSKDKYDWSRSRFTCPDGTFGHDPRGWAWGVYRYAPAGQGWNDYRTATRSAMNWQLVKGIRATGDAVGVIVARGWHAIDVVGYRTERDPWSAGPQSLLGFYVVDPWRGRGESGLPHWPFNGFAPNSYIDISDWNSRYFFKDIYEGKYWHGKYVAILRKAAGTRPGNKPGRTLGDKVYEEKLGSRALSAQEVGTTPAGTRTSLEQAIATGLEHHGLASDSRLDIDLESYAVGRVVHVDPVTADVAPYSLAELVSGGTVQAVVLVTETGDGYRFGALTPANGSRLPTDAGLRDVMGRHGLRGPSRLVWGWTSTPTSPFAPFIEGSDAAGGRAYLTRDGRVNTLDLVRAGAERD